MYNMIEVLAAPMEEQVSKSEDESDEESNDESESAAIPTRTTATKAISMAMKRRFREKRRLNPNSCLRFPR